MARTSHMHPSFWDRAYRNGTARWDLRSPSPVLAGLLDSALLIPGNVLVMGCGRGYDAVLFAEYGFSVTALDFSTEALRDARLLASERAVTIEFADTDIFTLPPSYDGSFQYVVEYVTYCAIDPAMRRAYADVVARVLAPGGCFVGLFFPVEAREGGPPFAVDRDEVLRLFGGRLRLLSSRIPSESVRQRLGREWLTLWTPHDGKGK